jgi:hypothetical protein
VKLLETEVLFGTTGLVADKKIILIWWLISQKKNIKLTYEKLSTRTIDHFKHKEQQTIMFACNLFDRHRQVYYRRIKRKINKEAKAIEVVSMINQKTMPRLAVVRNHITYWWMILNQWKLEEINYLIYQS